MPIFQYNGYRPDGTASDGNIEADGFHDAVIKVKALGIYPKEVKEFVRKRGRLFPGRTESVLMPYMTRQLSTLLSSGVPLVEALRSLSEESGAAWRGILVDVREKISGGASLSRALEGHGNVFPEFYTNMIAAGEQSGTLDRVLKRLADFLEKQEAVRARIRSAMLYPVFMICIGIIVMSFLFVFVIPKIVKIFEDTKSSLPFVTVVLIFVSNLFLHYWWLLSGASAAFLLGARRFQEKNRRTVDGMKLKIPGTVIKSLYFSRFAGTLSFLLAGGIPILKALELSGKSVGNCVLEGAVNGAILKVAEGASLSSSLEGFPPVLLQLIATGEKSGRLSEVLDNAAASYEEEFDRGVKSALSLLEPSMILLMGLVVGFIVFAVLLPMFQLNQLVK